MYEDYDDYPIDELDDEGMNAFSANEMTGAVPRQIGDEAEEESYLDVYPYYDLPQEFPE